MGRSRQMLFRYQPTLPEGKLPAERLVQCRELLTQLIVQVYVQERRTQEETNEREDPTDSS